MTEDRNKFLHLDSIIGWREARGSVSGSDFPDDALVALLIKKNIVVEDENNPGHLYFSVVIHNEEQLKKRLLKAGLAAVDAVLSLWRTSLKGRNLYEASEGVGLQRIPGAGRPLVDRNGTFGGLDYPTGVAVDRKGDIFIADTKNHIIKKYDICLREFITIGCLGGYGALPRQFNSPMGIAVSSGNNLYLADTGNNRVQAFSLKGFVLRRVWGGEGDGDGRFREPTDIAIDSRGDIYVVDRGNGRVQKFSHDGRFLLKFGGHGDGEGRFQNPTHIAVDRKNNLYVIDEGKEYVQVFDSEGRYIGKIEGPDEAGGEFKPLSIAIDNEGNVFIADGFSESIYRFSCGCGVYKSPEHIGRGIGFKGLCSYLTVDDGGTLYAALKERGIVAFEKAEDRYEREGFFISGPLESNIYKCRWHRLIMEADIPEGTAIEVLSFTSEDKKDIEDITKLHESRWSSHGANRKDFLLLSPPGRFLWLKVVLRGNVRSTPMLKNLRVYFPRATYLRYLPNVYKEDETSKDFLERFLSIFETVFSGIEERIDNIESYFNPRSAPEGFLPWLASWLALVLDKNWPVEKRRELIRLAPELYKKRGTLEGLRRYIEIYTSLGSFVSIIEHYKLRRWTFLGDSTVGCESGLWGKGITGRLQLDEYSTICSFRLISTKDPLMDPFHHYAHRFSVVIPYSFCDGKKKEGALRNIVEAEKPAHTKYSLCRVGPEFRVGQQSTIGVDSYVAAYPVTELCAGSRLGINSVLGQSPGAKQAPALSVGRSSRIGVDAVIN